ncbi:MAG: redox-sensing transcriptional repressor Rex [Elusimicrobia bacterium]|nr:redox-sensing transcriptional repressor Rex [Elusimicrobiota bacterium]
MNAEEQPRAIPAPTLRRLPGYLQLLKSRGYAPGSTVSCTVIAQALGLQSIQVRKDLAYTGITGRPKTGYVALELIKAIEDFLGWNNTHDALLFGVGQLGRALLSYNGFRAQGLDIVAGVDCDNAVQRLDVHGKKVIPLSKASSLIRRLHIKIAVITVPASSAQAVCDMAVAAGVKAVWNFAPVQLNVPEGIIVQNENLAASLAVLSKKLNLSLKAS